MSQATVRSLKVASWECSGHAKQGAQVEERAVTMRSPVFCQSCCSAAAATVSSHLAAQEHQQMRHHGVQIQKAFGGHLRQLPIPHGKSFGSIPDGHQGMLPTPKAVSLPMPGSCGYLLFGVELEPALHTGPTLSPRLHTLHVLK